MKEPILEIGCGNGTVLEYLLNKGLFAMGMDISKFAVFNCINHNRPVPAICQDAQDLFPFPDKSFKTVLMFHTFEHCMYPDRVLENINRVLDGNLCIVGPIPIEDDLAYGHFGIFKTYGQLKDCISKIGYKIFEFNEDIAPGIVLIATNKVKN